MFCHYFAEDIAIFVVRYGKELLQILHLDAKAWFQSLYGVRKYDDMKPQQVLLKVYGKHVRYFRSLPLHSSQEEIETHRDHSIFAYNLAPDYDFKQDILSFGDSIEVLEPAVLREAIYEIVQKMNNQYSK